MWRIGAKNISWNHRSSQQSALTWKANNLRVYPKKVSTFLKISRSIQVCLIKAPIQNRSHSKTRISTNGVRATCRRVLFRKKYKITMALVFLAHSNWLQIARFAVKNTLWANNSSETNSLGSQSSTFIWQHFKLAKVKLSRNYSEFQFLGCNIEVGCKYRITCSNSCHSFKTRLRCRNSGWLREFWWWPSNLGRNVIGRTWCLWRVWFASQQITVKIHEKIHSVPMGASETVLLNLFIYIELQFDVV